MHIIRNYYNSERILAIKDGTMAQFEHFWRPLPLIFSKVILFKKPSDVYKKYYKLIYENIY